MFELEKKPPAVRGPFKKKGKKNFYFEVNRKRRSLGTDDEEKAKQLVDEIRLRYKLKIQKEEKAPPPKKKVMTFDKFQKTYLEWAEKVQPTKTFKANRLAIRKLIPFCKDVPIDKVGAYHLDQMVAGCMEKGLKIKSINCYIRHSKTVMQQARRWGHIEKSPFDEYKQQRETKTPPKALERAQIDHLLMSIEDDYMKQLVRAYLITGRSRSELVRLQWPDIDFKKNQYFITRTKTHLSRWYPMSKSIRQLFLSMRPKEQGFVFHKRWHPDTITQYVKREMVNAGITDHNLHHLRHSFARIYLDAGGELRVLQDLLGHSQYSTTEVYASVGAEKISSEIERVAI